jgi:hypothetical protein
MSSRLTPEDIDLADLAETLASSLENAPAAGYVEGKTALRDIVLNELDCSALEAEQVVDTLVASGFLRFSGDPRGPSDDGVWRVDSDAS